MLVSATQVCVISISSGRDCVRHPLLDAEYTRAPCILKVPNIYTCEQTMCVTTWDPPSDHHQFPRRSFASLPSPPPSAPLIVNVPKYHRPRSPPVSRESVPRLTLSQESRTELATRNILDVVDAACLPATKRRKTILFQA